MNILDEFEVNEETTKESTKEEKALFSVGSMVLSWIKKDFFLAFYLIIAFSFLVGSIITAIVLSKICLYWFVLLVILIVVNRIYKSIFSSKK
jgi:hypothetical protein